MKANSDEGASAAERGGDRGPIGGPPPVPWRRTLVASVLWAGCAGLPFAVFAPFLATGRQPPDALLVFFLLPIIYVVPGVPLVLGSDLVPAGARVPILIAWSFALWTGLIRLEQRGRIEQWVLIGAPLFVGLAFAVMLPGYLGAKEKFRTGACDEAYSQPRDFLDAELAGLRGGGPSPRCGAGDAEGVANCFLNDRKEALNPRNRTTPAYAPHAETPCQVELRAVSPTRIEVRQQPVTGGVLRTYSIGID